MSRRHDGSRRRRDPPTYTRDAPTARRRIRDTAATSRTGDNSKRLPTSIAANEVQRLDGRRERPNLGIIVVGEGLHHDDCDAGVTALIDITPARMTRDAGPRVPSTALVRSNEAIRPTIVGLFHRRRQRGCSEVVSGLKTRVALVGVAAIVTGCNSTAPRAQAPRPVVQSIRLPVFEKSCSPQPGASPGAPSAVPIRIVDHVVIVANICINGKGPFPFLVDTGGSTTLVDSRLASRLHLSLVDGPVTISSFTCKRRISFAFARRWSVGDVALRPQTVVVGTVRSRAAPNLGGILGSDTLSSFGAVKIDYQRQTLTLGRQRPLLRSDVAGGSGPPSVSPSLTGGTAFVSRMPVKVVSTVLHPDRIRLTEVRPTVDLAVGSHRFEMTLDTGAGVTAVGPSVVRTLRLRPNGASATAVAGLDCPVVVRRYTIGPSALGTLSLAKQTVASNFIAPHLAGVIGSATLRNYSPVLVDYADGELLLGNIKPAQSDTRQQPGSGG